MGSTRCRHFVQNAWKKDLCSNCFKSRDEHAAAAPARPHPRQAIAPTPAAPPPQGILRGGAWTRTKSHRVCFPAEECEVIGEGGEDAGPPSDDDDDDDRVDWGTPVVEDDPQEQEEERLLQALTRSNTDFNSVAANLEASAPPPAASTPSKQRQQTTPLQLGRPQTDSQGRKQTLLVSVQPFGGPPGKSTGSPAKTAPAAAEHVTNIVLKSAPAPVPASKVPVPSSEVATPAVSSAAPSPSPTLLKLNDAQATPSKVAPPPLSSKHMFLKSIVEPASDAVVGTSVSVSAPVTTSTSVVSPPVKAPSPSPVPALSVVEASLCSSVSAVSSSVTAVTPTAAVVSSPVTATCPTVTAISSSPTKTTSGPTAASSTQAAKAVKTLVSSPKNVIVSAATTIPSSSTETSVSSTPTSNSPATTPSNPTRREGKRTHITRGTPISKNNELLLKTKLIPLRTSTILNNKRNSAGPEPPTLVKINGMRSEPVLLIESKQIDSSDEDDRTYSNVQVQSGSKRADENEAPPAPGTQTKRLSSLLAAAGTATGSPVGSREQAGEPDGRADPDSSSESGSEPPGPAAEPAPAVDPRPSFLHGLTARLASAATPGPVLMDKPRVPFKSSAVQRWSQVCSASPTPPSPVKAADEPPHAPSCSPPCSPETSPTDSPLGSPHGTPPADGSNRAHKRQAPQPPQEPPAAVQLTLGGVFVAPASPPASPSPPQHPVKEPPAPSPSSASTSPTRPALGRSASTGSSVSASPPSPVLSYLRKASLPPGPSGQSPVARQKDKRRASQHVVAPLPPIAPVRSESVPSALGQVALGHSVTLGAHSGHSIAQALAQANSFVSMAPSPGSSQPQPSPRRGLSLSTDSLGPSPKHVLSYDTERKKPGTKVRFSLRKFLGLAKDGGALRPDGSSSVEGVPVDPAVPPQPRPRPRLEIIHPSDLSGRAVEVLRASGVEVRRQLQEQAAQQQQAQQAASPQRGTMDALSEAAPTACSPDPGSEAAKGRPSKPPPPPRSQSLESGDAHCSPSRPSRPPPPKSAHVDMMLRRHSASPASPPTACSPAFMAPGHSVYANVACVGGEMRPSVAPTKPLRTGSIRDANADGPRRTPLDMKDVKDMDSPSSQPPKMPVRTSSLTSQPEDSGYESVELSDSTQPQSMTDSDNVYECVNGVAERSSSPECDSSSKRSAPRSSCVSAQYCGSETESDIYSPYSFYGSDEGDDGEAESWKWRSRARKGRSVVHKSMEDNYDAVVGANLEALAQLLEQIRTGPTVPTALRPLKTASGLGWSDFEPRDAGCVLAGRWAFVPALWRGHAVTLAVLTVAKSGRAAHSLSAPAPFALLPIAEFTDRVPVAYLPERLAAASTQTVQASVSVLARARVDTLSTYGARLQALQGSAEAAEAEAAWREAGLSLLQLFNAFMALQALRLDAIVDPDSVVFLRDPSQEGIPQLAVLHGMGSATDSDSIATASRCRCALMGVRALLNGAPVTPVLASLLEVDEAAGGASDALAVAKAVLEYWLWGPAEAVSSLPALQRWLDLERATVLHRLVCARAAAGPHHRLAIPQQSHLLFLVHTTAPAMSRASRLLEDACVRPLEAAS